MFINYILEVYSGTHYVGGRIKEAGQMNKIQNP